jgi:hypothetical protein
VTFIDYRRLDPWEEACGELQSIEEKDELLFAKISGLGILIPSIMEPTLRPLLKQRIAVLRTDLPTKQFLIRVLDKEQIGSSRGRPIEQEE